MSTRCCSRKGDIFGSRVGYVFRANSGLHLDNCYKRAQLLISPFLEQHRVDNLTLARYPIKIDQTVLRPHKPPRSYNRTLVSRLLLQWWKFRAALHFPCVLLFLSKLAAHVPIIVGDCVAYMIKTKCQSIKENVELAHQL